MNTCLDNIQLLEKFLIFWGTAEDLSVKVLGNAFLERILYPGLMVQKDPKTFIFGYRKNGWQSRAVISKAFCLDFSLWGLNTMRNGLAKSFLWRLLFWDLNKRKQCGWVPCWSVGLAAFLLCAIIFRVSASKIIYHESETQFWTYLSWWNFDMAELTFCF